MTTTAAAAPAPATTSDPTSTGRRCPWWVPALVLLLTEGQLAVAEFVPGIDRFADKAFGARLLLYPLLMLAAPAIWWGVSRWRGHATDRPPHAAFALIMLGFLVDVTGNSLDLYDTVDLWDDSNHLVNWFFLMAGIGMLIAPHVQPRWALALLIGGLGSALAVFWEIGEWYTFIRHGTEIQTAYTDTLGDETLGTIGAFAAGVLVAWLSGRKRSDA